VILDDLQAVDGVVWGLSDIEGSQPMPGATRATSVPKSHGSRNIGTERQIPDRARRPLDNIKGPKALNANAAAFSLPQVRCVPWVIFDQVLNLRVFQTRPTCGKQELPTINRATGLEHASSVTRSNAKEKHVRFLDAVDKSAAKSGTAEVPVPTTRAKDDATEGVFSGDGVPNSTSESLARILQEQLDRARATEVRIWTCFSQLL
jgi:hypothetical protein